MNETPWDRIRLARESLGLSWEEARDRSRLKKAYRQLLAAHPPDRDPERFQRIRAAYELLLDPVGACFEALRREAPGVAPPRCPVEAPEPVPGATALAILRVAVAGLPSASLLQSDSQQGSKEGS